MPSFGKILGAVLREKWSRTDPEFADGPTITSLTSTDVENCNVPQGHMLNVRIGYHDKNKHNNINNMKNN